VSKHLTKRKVFTFKFTQTLSDILIFHRQVVVYHRRLRSPSSETVRVHNYAVILISPAYRQCGIGPDKR